MGQEVQESGLVRGSSLWFKARSVTHAPNQSEPDFSEKVLRICLCGFHDRFHWRADSGILRHRVFWEQHGTGEASWVGVPIGITPFRSPLKSGAISAIRVKWNDIFPR